MTHTCTKVTVRQRAIRNNRISLYLDYYPAVRNPETMQMSRREYLGIYIYAHPKNDNRLPQNAEEAAEMYKAGGANDRAERELAEAKVLEAYQPAQMSDEDIAALVAKIAGELGAKGPKDMGKVMGKVMAAVKGQADGNRVKAAVQQHLASLAQ